MATKEKLQFQEDTSEQESVKEEEKEDENVERIKKILRKANWNYLNKHPEIRAIVRVILHDLINTKPTNVYQATAKLFDPNKMDTLINLINEQLARINAELKKNVWSEFLDGDMNFDRSSDENCEYSRCLLEFALVGENAEPCPLHPKEN